MEEVIKQTQGNRKLKQYLEDLKRNDVFIKKIQRIIKSTTTGKTPTNKEMDDFIEVLRMYHKKIKEYVGESAGTHRELINEIAEEYGLTRDLTGAIITSIMLKNTELPWGDRPDMCEITDNYDEYLNPPNPHNPPIPFELDTEKNTKIRAYPISIDIQKFASKRDVLDFIEKRWPIIDSYLADYRGGKNVRFRQRKIERKLSDFIWENKDKTIDEIKKEMNDKFPNNGLVYYEIYKIIGLERVRRTKKLNVGQ